MASPGPALQQRCCFYLTAHQTRHALILVHKPHLPLLFPVSAVSNRSPLAVQTRSLGFSLYFSVALRTYRQLISKVSCFYQDQILLFSLDNSTGLSLTGLHASGLVLPSKPTLYSRNHCLYKTQNRLRHICAQNPSVAPYHLQVKAQTPCGPGTACGFLLRLCSL